MCTVSFFLSIFVRNSKLITCRTELNTRHKIENSFRTKPKKKQSNAVQFEFNAGRVFPPLSVLPYTCRAFIRMWKTAMTATTPMAATTLTGVERARDGTARVSTEEFAGADKRRLSGVRVIGTLRCSFSRPDAVAAGTQWNARAIAMAVPKIRFAEMTALGNLMTTAACYGRCKPNPKHPAWTSGLQTTRSRMPLCDEPGVFTSRYYSFGFRVFQTRDRGREDGRGETPESGVDVRPAAECAARRVHANGWKKRSVYIRLSACR